MKTLPQFDLNINFFCPFTTFDEVRTSCFDLIWIHSIELRQRWLERVSHQYHQSFVPLDFLCSPISQKKHCASMMEAIALLSILTNAGTDAIWRPRPTHCQWLRRGNLCISGGPLHKRSRSGIQWLFAANTYKWHFYEDSIGVLHFFLSPKPRVSASGHAHQAGHRPSWLDKGQTVAIAPFHRILAGFRSKNDLMIFAIFKSIWFLPIAIFFARSIDKTGD